MHIRYMIFSSKNCNYFSKVFQLSMNYYPTSIVVRHSHSSYFLPPLRFDLHPLIDQIICEPARDKSMRLSIAQPY